MKQIVKKIVDMLSVLDMSQIDSFIDKLTPSEIKILYFEVIPEIPDLDLWNDIKIALEKKQRQLYEEHYQSIEYLQTTFGVTEELQTIHSHLQDFLTQQENSDLASSIPSLQEQPKLKQAETNAVQFTQDEERLFEECCQKGRDRIADQLGVAKLGEAPIRNRAFINLSIQSRVGTSLAAQVVAATETKNHGILMRVVDCLVEPNDSNETKETLFKAIGSVISDDNKMLDGKPHIFVRGGQPNSVTALEATVLEKILQSSNEENPYGINLSKEELEKLKLYRENMKRGQSIIEVSEHLVDVRNSGYTFQGDEIVKEDTPLSQEKQEQFEQKIAVAGKKLQQKCLQLQEGESIYINTGCDKHAMQLVITKTENNQFKLSTYDSSGSLENSEAIKKVLGRWRLPTLHALRLQRLGNKGMKKNAYTINVSQDKLASPKGMEYLTYLIRSFTPVGWAEQRDELKIKRVSVTERANMSSLSRALYAAQRSALYTLYKDEFAAISDTHAKFEDVLQRPQNTGNCFAKKAQSCELYQLGRPLYRKLRKAILLEQKNGLIEDACGEIADEEVRFLPPIYTQMIKDIEPEYLSPSELHTLSLRLSELDEPPSPEYYQRFFKALLKTREELLLLPIKDRSEAVQRINNKINSHARDFYLFLQSSHPPKTDEIKAIFTDAVMNEDFNWSSGLIPLRTQDEDALKKLSEFAAAQAWKAIIQVINHQIKKLGVAMRVVNTESPQGTEESGRLQHIDYKKISSLITDVDLENANIVRVYEGFDRKETIAVEIYAGNERKEIDIDTFFSLAVEHQESLTNPKVIGLLGYLRNTTPEIERLFRKKVFTIQRDAFAKKQQENIKKTTIKIEQRIDSLTRIQLQLEEKIQSLKADIDRIEKAIEVERNHIGLRKNSIELQNLQLHHSALKNDLSDLKQHSIDIAVKLQAVSSKGEESPLDKINQLNNPKIELLRMDTINAVSQEFFKSQQILDDIEQNLGEIKKESGIIAINHIVNHHIIRANEYREKVITNHLKTNAEYRILDELSSGLRLGTEKDRNRNLKSQSGQAARSHFLKKSIFNEIQVLNKTLKKKVEDLIEHQVILSSETPYHSTIDALESADQEYIKIKKLSQKFSSEPISQDIKDKWVRGMFTIWIKHESPKNLLSLQKGHEANIAGINQAFHVFLEQKANIKYAALKEAGFNIDLNQPQLQAMGWSPITLEKLKVFDEDRIEKAKLISETFRARPHRVVTKTKMEEEKHKPVSLQITDLEAKSVGQATIQTFNGPQVDYISLEAGVSLEGSTLQFLREHKVPKLNDSSPQECLIYFQAVQDYLLQLKSHMSLENKAQRIRAFCYSSAEMIFTLPIAPQKELLTEIANTIIEHYKDEQGSIKDAFIKLENNERSQLLATLIKLYLSPINKQDDAPTIKVNPKFYSIIKQWEQLITPPDQTITKKIAQLSPGGSDPIDIELLYKIDVALHESPVSLEGLYEGQEGLQAALTVYGQETAIDTKLRKVADRLSMRHGDHLLAHQFINYYSDKTLLFSSDGIKSTQGRELFSRAFLAAFTKALPEEKEALLQFIQSLNFDDPNAVCTLKTSHQVFIEDLLVRCGDTDEPILTETFIQSLTDKSCIEGSDRLFGFAKEINMLSLQITHALKSDKDNLDKLYSRLICSHLAYQLLLEQAGDEVISNLKENFEYTKEMVLAETNMQQLQEELIAFTQTLSLTSSFSAQFNKYNQDKKFDGPLIRQVESVSASDIPGFIVLGNNSSLDVLHGVIYIGNNRLGIMPSYIQSHITLQELGLNHLPFKPDPIGGYAYLEDNDIKVRILPFVGSELTIQRKLATLDGSDAMLQYVPQEKMGYVSDALSTRLHVAHFFIDSIGAVHGYTSDFKPILKLSNLDGAWAGFFYDHQNNKTPLTLNPNKNPMRENLAKVFPETEMITVDTSIVYIPSIAKYLISEGENFLITDNLDVGTVRKNLKITEEGSALIEKVLTKAEQQEVASLKNKIDQLHEKHSTIIQLDLLNKQTKSKISKEIESLKLQITTITTPECLVFNPDSEQVKNLETQNLELRTKMQEVYAELKVATHDRVSLSKKYSDAKEAYLHNKKTVQKALEQANYLLRYDIKEERLFAKDFQSILHVGSIPGKTSLFTELLGENIPNSPLKSNELEELRRLKAIYQEKQERTPTEQVAFSMLIGTEIQHHLLERSLCAIGRLEDWDRETCSKLIQEFSNTIKNIPKPLLLNHFDELWRAIQAEFVEDTDLQKIFYKPPHPISRDSQKSININTKTTNMPIESMGGRALVQFTVYTNPEQLIDITQLELQARLRDLKEESVLEQEEGYYYENYGLFNTNTLEKLFSITQTHPGIGGLTQEDVAVLFKLMLDEKWIAPVTRMDNKFQLTRHPSDFYAATKIAGYLTKIGLDENQIRAISERLEIFLYQTAVCGGAYSITPDARVELINKVQKTKETCNLEYLQAFDKIQSILDQASEEITMTDLNAAYLLNDFSSILSYFPIEKQAQIVSVLNNAMTRLLYYKTELDHLSDIQDAFDKEHDAKAIAMLHIRRNYSLDKLLDSQSPQDKTSKEQFEQERKMQRAFMLFESEFKHRCNARQVNIFRGLLLDDETDPDKIDSAQARMGFGKTSLLPFVALYKTGEKLVRFIVPKSALETNTSDMSKTLANILGRRAIKDDFKRYRIETDPESNMGAESPRLKSLQNAKEELQRRLILYRRIQENREVLIQAPSVRNAMECQEQIFLDMLIKIQNEPLHQKELLLCIKLLNEIRSFTTVSVFDELDATQNPTTTEVNYTAGEKKPLDPDEIEPLEVIIKTIGETPNKSVANLANVLLPKFNISVDEKIIKYVTTLQEKQPDISSETNKTALYLIRGILTDPIMLQIFTEKESGTDFGIWFENSQDGSKCYDHDAVTPEREGETRPPLLIAVPYAAANTPKPKGSRFDNPEVTAITTFLYYLDPRTEINEIPHLEFLIDSFRESVDDKSIQLYLEENQMIDQIKQIAEIEDPITRREKRRTYFTKQEEQIKSELFRKLLARTIIQKQVKFDAGKANSNRYEQGTVTDTVIGFSGTAGDTSSHFQENMLDPAADGNMTLGIMGRANCQNTISLDTTRFLQLGEDYTATLIKQLADDFTQNTRALIDVGGLCKLSNRAVAKELALQLRLKDSPLKGVIFYDDVTNMKKCLLLDDHCQEIIIDLTEDMVKESERHGSYFTYFDQSHSRGADTKQMDNAHAVLTLNFTVTNNDFKQAIMRMRKIIDKSSGQSFSTAVPKQVEDKIISDLNLSTDHKLTGNDIAFWLRQQELKNNLTNVSVFMMELDAIIKNTIMQQQAKITELMAISALSDTQIQAFQTCITELNDISPFISGGTFDLGSKYGKVCHYVKKDEFVNALQESFKTRLNKVFDVAQRARETMQLESIQMEQDKAPYLLMLDRVIQKRQPQLPHEFMIPSTTSVLAEIHTETESHSESQSQSQSQSQTQTHSFSEVANEEVIVDAQLIKQDLSFSPLSLDYLKSTEAIENLALANQILPLHHILNENDPIRCSPAYKHYIGSSLKHEQQVPPVHYFLAQEHGEPKIILINQDEADLFKKSPTAPWSLYDIRLQKDEELSPIIGEALVLDSRLMKKLYFASYRYPVSGNDLNSLTQSFEGMYCLEQLKPSLHMTTTPMKTQVFQLPRWGFSGETQQKIPLNITQTQVTYRGEYKKTGVTISMGEDEERKEIFISSKLNDRILKQARKREQGGALIKPIIEEVTAEYERAKDEKNTLHKKKDDYRQKKKKIFENAADKIQELKAIRTQAIKASRDKMQTTYELKLSSLINFREQRQALFKLSLNKMIVQTIGKFTPLHLGGINGMVKAALQEIAKGKETPLDNEQIEKEINKSIESIANQVGGRYGVYTDYNNSKTTLLQEIHNLSNQLTKVHGNEPVWGIVPLDRALKSQMYDKFIAWYDFKTTTPAEKTMLWDSFVKTISDVINNNPSKSIEEFETILYGEIKKFTKEKCKEKSNDAALKTASEIMNAIALSFEPVDIIRVIKDIVRKEFIALIRNPSEEQENLYKAIYSHLNSINEPPIRLPLTLAHPNQESPISIEEINRAIQETLPYQKIEISNGRVKARSENISQYVAGQKWLDQTLEHFKPVENRRELSEQIDQVKAKLFPDMVSELSSLDKTVLDIDKKIHEEKIKRKEELKALEEEYADLPHQIKKNQAAYKKLHEEKAASNKLSSGSKKVITLFDDHLVHISEEDQTPASFIDSSFNLEKIIQDKVLVSAKLEFTPPEFYDVETDMKQQVRLMHGLNAAEIPSQQAFAHAASIVRNTAAQLQTRECIVVDEAITDRTAQKKDKSVFSIGLNRNSIFSTQNIEHSPKAPTASKSFEHQTPSSVAMKSSSEEEDKGIGSQNP